ncbi:MAG: flagellar biosynthetic protein FliR [Burkholderiales bacterium]
MISFSLGEIEALLGQFLWPFIRVLALLMAAPVFSHRTIPARIKISAALAITLVIAPALPAPGLGAFGPAAWLLVAEQILVGVAIGFSLRVVFAAVEMAGDMIGLQMGLSFATFVDPQNSNQSPLIGSFLAMVATLLFLAIDGHLLLIAALSGSFEVVPVGAGSLSQFSWQHLALLGTQLFSLGLQIAMPVLATMLVVNLALGVMARAAPQLNLFSVGFPLTLATGTVLLAAFLPYLRQPLEEAFRQALRVWT